MTTKIIQKIILIALFIFAFWSLVAKKIVFAQSPTLLDFWEERAKFSQEERVRFPGTPYNTELDFYYNTHDSGMAVIEDINNQGTVYYLTEWWKGNNPDYLEPHLYKSTDNGKTFTHLTKLFDVLGPNETTCPSNSTYAHWADLQGQAKWCLFQMREPEVMFYNGHYYIVYESAAKSGSQVLIGPTVVKLPNLDINQPVPIQHGINFRQHPLFLTYDGDPNQVGLQETSASTPFWAPYNNGLYVFWIGVHPINSTWEIVDTYRGHYTRTPGSPQADCTDPIWCFFAFDEYLITNPNFAHLPSSPWESKNVDGMSIIQEGNYQYLFYAGADHPDSPNPDLAKRGGMSIVRSGGLTNWQRKFFAPEKLILYAEVEETNFTTRVGFYGKLVKIEGEYYIYYIKCGLPFPEGSLPIARTYRMKLDWVGQTISLSAGWNEITWPTVTGIRASDIPPECPIAVAKENFWFKPYVKDFGGLNFGFESGKSYYLKCNQQTIWQL